MTRGIKTRTHYVRWRLHNNLTAMITLCCIIVLCKIPAVDGSVRKPCEALAKFGFVLLSENIFIFDKPPHMECRRSTGLDIAYFLIWDVFINNGTDNVMVLGTDNIAALDELRFETEIKIGRDRWTQDCSFGSTTNHSGRSESIIDHNRLCLKTNTFIALLVDSGANDHGQIGSHLSRSAFSNSGNAILSSASADGYMRRYALHSSGGTSRCIEGAFHIYRLLFSSNPQSSGSIPKSSGIDGQQGRKYYQEHISNFDVYKKSIKPIGLIFWAFVVLAGSIVATVAGLRSSDQGRLVRGRMLQATGCVLAFAGPVGVLVGWILL